MSLITARTVLAVLKARGRTVSHLHRGFELWVQITARGVKFIKPSPTTEDGYIKSDHKQHLKREVMG